MGEGGKLRGWKIKLSSNTDPGFGNYGDDDGYCIPLSDDTPEFKNYILVKNYFYWLFPDSVPELEYYNYGVLNADKGVIYRIDNPNLIYPAFGNSTNPPLFGSFRSLFTSNGESIDSIINKEFTIIYDPDRDWKPTTKLTVTIVEEPNQYNDESACAFYCNTDTPLPDYTTLSTDNGYYYSVGSTHEVALTDIYFFISQSYVGVVYTMDNCELLTDTMGYGKLFKVLDPSKDVYVLLSTYDPTH